MQHSVSRAKWTPKEAAAGSEEEIKMSPATNTPSVIGGYKIRSRIGAERSQSFIWRAADLSNGQDVVLKQIPLLGLTRNLKECLDCELNFLSKVRHPNIIRLFDVLQDDECVFLVMEFCEGGRLRESVVQRFMKQIGEGLEVLRAHHIIHRDLKPENILLSTPSSDAVLKIADFDLSNLRITLIHGSRSSAIWKV